nr:zinc finger BED domain-containing protein RICESLEEPER 3 [Tanacetum cinerariifolium]
MFRDESIFVYNPDVLRERFASLVIQQGLPFNHFDDEQTTRVFQNRLQLKYNHTAPHGLPGSYICVTAHWIKPGTWQMMKRVIAFEDFLVSHTGSALAKTLRNVFVNFNLENKIMSITLDNASNNTSAIGVHFSAENWVTIESLTQLLEVFNNGTQILSGVYYPTSPLAKETMFPVLSRMAMDILSVQATSVAYESAFSISGRVLSIRRTRLTPESLEMCMCLKDHLDAQERKQDKSTFETPIDFEEEKLDVEVQENEAISLSDEEIALDAASNEGSMSGPGSEGEEATDYGHGYDVYQDDY